MRILSLADDTWLSMEGGVFMKDEKESLAKKNYEQPRVTTIDLRPEEAVLGSCKSMTSAGPVGSACHAVGNCQGIGS